MLSVLSAAAHCRRIGEDFKALAKDPHQPVSRIALDT
jgi:hypothetical protein